MSQGDHSADWQTRSLAFLIDLILYTAIFYGLGGVGHFLSMLYMVFRDGIFAGQSIGKKVMKIQVVHADGRAIHFVDSSFRNVPFLLYLLLPVTIVIEAIVLMRDPDQRRIGDRIAKTHVIRKEAVSVLA